MGTVYHSGNTALGLKNLLINANGLVNQRGYVSGTATTVANQYTVDRWRVVTSGQNLTFTTTNGITTFTAPAGGVEQVIENLNIIGGSYVFSHVGTATKNVYQSSDNVTYTEVIAVDGIYTVTGGYYVKIKFSNGTFSLPQFEAGKLVSAFEQRPIGLELSLCQRYYEVGKYCWKGSNTTIGHTMGGQVYFKTQKIVSPTIVTTTAGDSGFAGATLTNSLIDSNGFRHYRNVVATGNADYDTNYTASAEL